MSAYVSGERIKKDFPQVERTVYAQDNEPVLVKDGRAEATEHWLFANDDFLKVVSLPLVSGTTLTAPETVAPAAGFVSPTVGAVVSPGGGGGGAVGLETLIRCSSTEFFPVESVVVTSRTCAPSDDFVVSHMTS